MAFRKQKKNPGESGYGTSQHPDKPSDTNIFTTVISFCSGLFRNYLNPLFQTTYNLCRLSARGVARRVQNFYRFCHRHFVPHWRRFTVAVRERGSDFLRSFKAPAFKIRRGWYLVKRNYHIAEEEKGRWGGFVYSLRTFAEGLVNNKNLLRAAVNYVLPVLMIAVLVTVVASVQTLTFAVEVNYNGKTIGYIEDEKIFEEAEKMMQQRILYQSDEEVISVIPEYTLTLVSREDILDGYELADNMVRQSDLDITEAEGVYVGDQFYGAVENTVELEEALDGLLAVYRSDAENETVEFERPISYRTGLYLRSSVVNDDELIQELTGMKESTKTYTVKEGDSPYVIAEQNGVSLGELVSLNPGILESCFPGDTVVLSQSVPYLSVKISRTETYEEAIAYETVEVQDNKYLKGVKRETQAGENGSRTVTATVEYVNGAEVSRTVLESTVTKDPVERRVTVGTAEPIQVAPGGGSPAAGSGAFINPCPAGYVSQEYGNYGHKGMDIAAPYGSAIYASAPGTVILAKWYAGYGNCVMIDHGGGVVTLYGHASALYVSQGQSVAQGQTIAAVGSTGWSSGNHCHFEVRVNGGFQNPRRYL